MSDVVVTRTAWDGPELRIHAQNLDGTDLLLHWRAGDRFHWHVGDMVQPTDTPHYVFEPRSVDAITRDLDAATTETARTLLAAEQRLCAQPHVVYVAFYGTLPKVGMTQADRLAVRLREQGADAGFVVATTDDRAGARGVENAVSFRYRLPQWRTHKELLPQWTRPMDFDRVQARADDLRRRLAPAYDGGPLTLIDDHPLPVLDGRPDKVSVVGEHVGTVVGAKGNFLVYRPDPHPGRLDVGHAPLKALKRGDLEGRALRMDDGQS